MSGITGVYYLEGRSVDRQDLQKMVDSLAHRGPDGAEIWHEGEIGFGHRMLWTTPESLIEKLPLVRDNLTITADARIDNRNELKSVLDLPDRPLEKITDSEFILAAYKEWGEDCPKHLLGDFAFAIWDKKKQKLFCARDHFGIKPFYYYRSKDSFIFASEIKALFSLPETPRRLNEVRIADFLALMMEDKVITTYQDILRLPPAHTLSITPAHTQIRLYWSLDRHRELRLNSDEDYAASFREIFTEAVRCRLRSASPVVCHLSGGLDSSAVACVAQNLLAKADNTRLHTISSIFDTITECDERPYINAVLKQGDYIPHFVPGDQLGPLSNLDQIFQYEDEALLGPSHIYPWNLNRTCKELGLRVCLDGYDGDTTVCHGTTRLAELAGQGDWTSFIQEAKCLATHHNIAPVTLFRAYGLLHFENLARQFRWIKFVITLQQIHRHFGVSRKSLLIRGLRSLLQQQHKITNNKSPALSLLNRQFAERIELDERIRQLDSFAKLPLTVREDHWYTLARGGRAYTLEQMDQYAAMFSLEARHPFMDKRLIEFCLALPSEQKLFQGWGRMVMRRALEGILPEEIQWRGGKADLTPNFMDGLLNRNRQILDEVMTHKLHTIERYVDINFLRAAYQRLVSGSKATDRDSTAIWQATVLASWFDHKQIMPPD